MKKWHIVLISISIAFLVFSAVYSYTRSININSVSSENTKSHVVTGNEVLLPTSFISESTGGSDSDYHATQVVKVASPDGQLVGSVQQDTGNNLAINFSVFSTISSSTKSYSFIGENVDPEVNIRYTGKHTTLTWLNDETLIISELYNINDFRYAIYKYDLKTQKPTLLVDDMRTDVFDNMAISRTDNKIYYVTDIIRNTDTEHLVSLDMSSGKETTILTFPIPAPDGDYQFFEWSHTGNMLLYYNTAKHTLEIFEPSTGHIISLGNYDAQSEIAGNRWSPDDTTINVGTKIYRMQDNSQVDVGKQLTQAGFIAGFIEWYGNNNLLVPINQYYSHYEYDSRVQYVLFNINDYTVKKVVFQ